MRDASQAITDLPELLRQLSPTLHGGVYVFVSVPVEFDYSALQPIAMFLEAEGRTLVLRDDQAQAAALDVLFRAAWITLSVHSDLQAIGLTAAVAAALTQAGISCNVLAGAFHDHVFVPVECAATAIGVLKGLQGVRD